MASFQMIFINGSRILSLFHIHTQTDAPIHAKLKVASVLEMHWRNTRNFIDKYHEEHMSRQSTLRIFTFVDEIWGTIALFLERERERE